MFFRTQIPAPLVPQLPRPVRTSIARIEVALDLGDRLSLCVEDRDGEIVARLPKRRPSHSVLIQMDTECCAIGPLCLRPPKPDMDTLLMTSSSRDGHADRLEPGRSASRHRRSHQIFGTPFDLETPGRPAGNRFDRPRGGADWFLKDDHTARLQLI